MQKWICQECYTNGRLVWNTWQTVTVSLYCNLPTNQINSEMCVSQMTTKQMERI